MNKTKKSTHSRKPHESKKVKNAEEASVTKISRADVSNNDSTDRSCDLRLSGHSTPIRKRDSSFNLEGSPELNYRCSPILFPCTQDGGNEIAWDWQCSAVKSTNEKSKNTNSLVDTPKRTKLLQKKRNSNSPLLQKPLKRKQVKLENIENIGKLAAELKALTEKMGCMRQVSDNQNNEEDKKQDSGNKLVELDLGKEESVMLEVVVNGGTTKVETVKVDNVNQKTSSYDDLFDDSIDDSMVKCSQEIEEKFNLGRSKDSDATGPSMIGEERRSLTANDRDTSNNSKDYSKNSSASKNSSRNNTSNYLKTYSKNSSKTSSVSSIHASNSKEHDLQKSYLNNNVINALNENMCGKRTMQEVNRSGFFEIPDDSFDDCLATCIEDEKLVSKSSEYDDIFADADHNTSSCGKISKQSNSNVITTKRSSSFVPKGSAFSYSAKPNDSKTFNHEGSKTSRSMESMETSPMENRKFFKTKSLSDQYFGQGRNASSSTKPNKNPAQASANPITSPQNLHTNSVPSSVSTTFPVVKKRDSYKDNNFSSTNGAGNAHELNRSAGREGGNRIIKYKSTSSLCSNAKEHRKDVQPARCTPEEIERKRLEAKTRLEAKRKLQQSTKTIDVIPEVQIKRSVKR